MILGSWRTRNTWCGSLFRAGDRHRPGFLSHLHSVDAGSMIPAPGPWLLWDLSKAQWALALIGDSPTEIAFSALFGVGMIAGTAHQISRIALTWTHAPWRRIALAQWRKFIPLPAIVLATTCGIRAGHMPDGPISLHQDVARCTIGRPIREIRFLSCTDLRRVGEVSFQ